MFNKYLYLAILVVLMGVGAKLYTYHTDALEAAKASVVSEYDRAYVQGLEEQIEASKALLTASKALNEELANEKTTIGTKYSVLLDSVRKRPSREESYSAPDDTGSCPAPTITGQGLSREDAEFLAGEAASAMTIMSERDMYYRSYNSVKNELDKLNDKD